MNEPRPPNVATDLPSTLAPAPPSDQLSTVDHVRGSADTDESLPAAQPSTETLPAVLGYQVLHEIARGGMGRVLAAHDLTLGRDVAIKLLLPGANAARFVRESKITARLPHPGIPPVHALGTLDDGSPFMAMKLVAGKTLAEEIKTADRPRLLQIFTQLAHAVGFAHSLGVVHRDLKPANVMVGAFGEVQVMDWGLAKDSSPESSPDAQSLSTTTTAVADATGTFNASALAEATDQTRAGAIVGTPSYMPPEQARGEPVDAPADVFTLGGILCAILTGHPPFRNGTARQLIDRAAANDLSECMARLDGCNADPELVALCRRCLSPIKADRLPDGQAVAEAMSAYLAGVQDRLHALDRERAVAAAKAIEDRRRRNGLYIAGSIIVLTLVVGVIGTTLAMFDARRHAEDAKKGWGEADVKAKRFRALTMEMSTQISQLQSAKTDVRLAHLARREAMDKARAAFEQLRKEQPDDVEVQRQAALLHRFSANTSRFLNELDLAHRAYGSSIQILEDVAARFPSDKESRYSLAQTLADLASLEMLAGRLSPAEANLRRAATVAEGAVGDELTPDRARTLAFVNHDQARVAHLQGKFEVSLRFASHARDRLDELSRLARAPRQKQAVDPLLTVFAINDAAVAHRELGRTDEALAAHDDALARLKTLDVPNANKDITYWICEVREQRGRTAIAHPPLRAAAAADLLELSRIAEKLVEDFPHINFYQQKLAAIRLTRGELLTALRQPETAVAELINSLTTSRALLDRFGVLPDSTLVRGQAYLALARAKAMTGRTSEAHSALKNAAKVFEIAAKEYPDHFHLRRGLAEAQKELKASAK